MRIGVGRKPARGNVRSRGQPKHFWLSCCQTCLHDFSFHSIGASLAPLSEVCLELSYLWSDYSRPLLHLPCHRRYPSWTRACLSARWGYELGGGLSLLQFPAREPESGLPS